MKVNQEIRTINDMEQRDNSKDEMRPRGKKES